MSFIIYEGKEIGLDEDCRIDPDSVNTNTMPSIEWNSTHKDMEMSSSELQDFLTLEYGKRIKDFIDS